MRGFPRNTMKNYALVAYRATLYHENLLAATGSTVIPGQVLVIEITKLKEEKRGGGVTLPVDAFEGRNLVFVDEGHKGKGSEERVWARLRDALGSNGFTFEYSATFGQILSEKDWTFFTMTITEKIFGS